jgi:hypothetical protein
MVVSKRGISAIVATVLIILISIVGVGIIWGVILPLFEEVGYLSYSDIKLDILLEGYTVYDPEMHFAFVQVARGNDNLNLTAVEVIFTINGSSVPYRNYDYPSKNEKKNYKFNFTYDGIDGDPSEVSVAPVFNLNGQEKIGEILSTKEIPNQKVDLSEPQWGEAKGQAITSVVKEDYLINHPCSNDLGCSSQGSFCEGNLTYSCVKRANGCLDKITSTNCSAFSKVCSNGVCVTRCPSGQFLYGGICAIDINSLSVPYNLNVEGATYVLTGDLGVSGEGLLIGASSIVVDGRGYDLIGNGGERGVYTLSTSSQENIYIKNFGNISRFQYGIFLEGVNNSVIENNTLNSDFSLGDTIAIYLKDGKSNRVERNNILWTSGGYRTASLGLFVEDGSGRNLGGNNITRNNISAYSYIAEGICFENLGISNLNIINDNYVRVSSWSGYGIDFANYGVSNSSLNIVKNNTIKITSTKIALGVKFGNSASGIMSSNIIEGNTACELVGSQMNYGFYCTQIIAAEFTGAGNRGLGICGNVGISACS